MSLDTQQTRIAIVGIGVMGEAMLAGMLARDVAAPGQVICSHPRAERRQQLEERFGVRCVGDNEAAIHDAELLILAVKPQMLAGILPQLRGKISAAQTVLSVIAGASTAAIGAGLAHPAVVRAMPNTPAQIGSGVSVWFATEAVSESGKKLVRHILDALGKQFEVHDESQVAMSTAVSGTGPTYVFMFVEALTDAAVHLGFPRHVARELVLDTVAGSTAFALQSGRHPAELRDMVTSPGGTSAEALYQMEKGGFRTVISDAVWAAFKRTLALEAKLEGRG